MREARNFILPYTGHKAIFSSLKSLKLIFKPIPLFIEKRVRNLEGKENKGLSIK